MGRHPGRRARYSCGTSVGGRILAISNFGDIAPEWGGTGSPMAAGVYVWGVVVGRTLPGGDRRNLGAQLQKLSELAHFLCDQNLALF